MATLTNQQAAGGTAVVDRRGPAPPQAEPAMVRGIDRPSRLKVRTLVNLRWLIIAGEVVILAFVGLIMGYSAPYELCFALIGLSAWLNLLIGVASPGQRIAGDWEAAGQLGLDIAQITGLVYLTGGAGNPFMLILIAPVTVAAATLPQRPVLAVGGLAIAASLGLAFFGWPNGSGGLAPLPYRLGAAAANLAGIVLIAGYVRQAAEESARMALALAVTQAVLAREQRQGAGILHLQDVVGTDRGGCDVSEQSTARRGCRRTLAAGSHRGHRTLRGLRPPMNGRHNVAVSRLGSPSGKSTDG